MLSVADCVHDSFWMLLIDGAAQAELGVPCQRRRPRWTLSQLAVRDHCVKSRHEALDPRDDRVLERRPYVQRTAPNLRAAAAACAIR